jgi:hypothetical protein
VLKDDVPYGKIIKTPLSAHPLEMVPGFPVSNPGIVFLAAGPIFHGSFDYDLLKLGR